MLIIHVLRRSNRATAKPTIFLRYHVSKHGNNWLEGASVFCSFPSFVFVVRAPASSFWGYKMVEFFLELVKKITHFFLAKHVRNNTRVAVAFLLEHAAYFAYCP